MEKIQKFSEKLEFLNNFKERNPELIQSLNTDTDSKISIDNSPEVSNIPQIKVWFTKTLKIRAKIKESKKSIPYEVTIGGNSWKSGKGRQFEDIIKRKTENLLNELNKQFKESFKNE